MSAMTVKYFNGGLALNGVGAAAGPGLNAPYLDQMGWMPSFRQYFYTPGTTVDLPLLALSHATGVGYYEVVIPMADKVGYPGHYLTVEYRYPDGWDKGIGSPAVLIHEVLSDGRSVLLTKTSGGPWPAYSVFHDPTDNVAVGIGGFHSSYYPQAWIEVSPDYAGDMTPTLRSRAAAGADRMRVLRGQHGAVRQVQPATVSELELGFGGPGSWQFPGLDSEVKRALQRHVEPRQLRRQAAAELRRYRHVLGRGVQRQLLGLRLHGAHDRHPAASAVRGRRIRGRRRRRAPRLPPDRVRAARARP